MTTETPASSPVRSRLSATRTGMTKKVVIAGKYDLYITLNFFENDQPGELFVVTSTHGSTISGLCDTIAVMVSMNLQVGVPLAMIAAKLRHVTFEPRDDQYASYVDAIAKTMLELASQRGSHIDLSCRSERVQWATPLEAS